MRRTELGCAGRMGKVRVLTTPLLVVAPMGLVAAAKVRVGYMNRWLPNARGGDGRMEHAALLWFTQSVDLFKKKRGYKEPKYDIEEFPGMGSN